MYMAMRKYRASASDMDELERRVLRDFVPLIRKAEGFLDYYFVRTGRDAYLTISVFEEQEQVEASTRMAAEWIKQNVLPMLPNPPEIITGEVTIAAHSGGVQPEFSATRPEAPSLGAH